MNRVSEVERINDGAFFLDHQIIVVQKAQYLLLDLHAVRIKQEECLVVVKITLIEANCEFDKVLNMFIPIRNLSWDFRNFWYR